MMVLGPMACESSLHFLQVQEGQIPNLWMTRKLVVDRLLYDHMLLSPHSIRRTEKDKDDDSLVRVRSRRFP
jgi:hypothetical protein